MKTKILLVGFLASLIGCAYPVILVGPRPKDWPHQIEYWSKPDASTEQSVADSITCKGDEKGDPIESQANLQAARLPEEEDTKLARRRLFHNWERCMMGKGYRYTGKCYLDDHVSSARPACGAP